MVVDPHVQVAAQVLWVLLPSFVANATAVIPRGRGPPLDLGAAWPWDGRRLLGPSKSWSGFLFGIAFAFPIGLLEAYLIGIAPPDLAIVPSFGPTVVAAIPVVLLLAGGAMLGDALGSFIKRRLGRASGARTLFLDQLPFVLVPVGLGLLVDPALFVPTFVRAEALAWLLAYTLGMHALFNYIGYWVGWKKVPW